MIYVSEIEDLRIELLDIFPDAIRGSKSKSRWGDGVRQLHLSFSIMSDTVGGYLVEAKGDLWYFVEWDSNYGYEYLFAERYVQDLIERIREMFNGETLNIERTVCSSSKQS